MLVVYFILKYIPVTRPCGVNILVIEDGINRKTHIHSLVLMPEGPALR